MIAARPDTSHRPRGHEPVPISLPPIGELAKISLIAMASITAAPASFAADPVRGEKLAQQWCSSCHVVGQPAPKTVQEGPPSFRMVAESGVTQDQLRIFLSHPHGAMPNLSLSRSEIADLIAYIESLR